MSRPDTPFEAASYDLKQFRERRMAERRMTPRDGTDRRTHWNSSVGELPIPLIVLPPLNE